MSSPPHYAAGWGWPIWPKLSKKAHYFRAWDTRSLCKRWMYTGKRWDSNDESPDNCAECKRKLRAFRRRESKR